MKYIFQYILFSLFISTGLVAQSDNYKETIALLERKETKVLEMMIVEGDTFMVASLPEVEVIERKFRDNKERYRYNKLKRNIIKVYPYATRVSDLINEIESTTASIDKRRKQKKYLRKLEKELKSEFKEELKKLTVSQGKVLIELIERETGQTFKEILKNYKGGVSIAFYEVIGKRYGYEFDTYYDPYENEDLETIVRTLEGY